MYSSQYNRASSNFYKRRELRSASVAKKISPSPDTAAIPSQVLNMDNREIRTPGGFIVYSRRKIDVNIPNDVFAASRSSVVVVSTTIKKHSLLGKYYYRKQRAFQGDANGSKQVIPSCKDFREKKLHRVIHSNSPSFYKLMNEEGIRNYQGPRASVFRDTKQCSTDIYVGSDFRAVVPELSDVVNDNSDDHVKSNTSPRPTSHRKYQRSFKSTNEDTAASNHCLLNSSKSALCRKQAFINVYKRRKMQSVSFVNELSEIEIPVVEDCQYMNTNGFHSMSSPDPPNIPAKLLSSTRRCCFNGFLVYTRKKADDGGSLNGSTSSKSDVNYDSSNYGTCESSSTLIKGDTTENGASISILRSRGLLGRYCYRRKRIFHDLGG